MGSPSTSAGGIPHNLVTGALLLRRREALLGLEPASTPPSCELLVRAESSPLFGVAFAEWLTGHRFIFIAEVI